MLEKVQTPGHSLRRILTRSLPLAAAAFLATCALLGAMLGESAIRPLPRALPPTPPGFEAVTMGELRAWWSAPGPDRCALVLHGVGDTRAGSPRTAHMLLNAGYRVLLPDSRGHGESGGGIVTYGVLERRDVAAWAAWMRARGCRRVVALGRSMGAAILLQAQGERPLFDALVAECPFATFRRIARDRILQNSPLPRAVSRLAAWPAVEFGLAWVRLRHGVNLAEASPRAAIPRIRAALLLIHGTADSNIVADHSTELAGARQGTELWLVPGAGHGDAISREPMAYRSRVIAHLAALAD